ncbi:MAG TPA: ROK family protein [Sporichthyaceae bacterium]|nr:ROK family protein [Sporichthyaceae bacterium]
MPAESAPVLAVDIGGTKLAAGVVDADGRVLTSGRVPTPGGEDAEVLWDALRGLIEKVRAEAVAAGSPAPYGIGVGSGGPMRWPEGVISPLNIPAWHEFPLRHRLRELARGAPVRVHNDAVALALGEHRWGAGRGHANMLGMVASTGVGGGLVLGGRVVDGASGNAGHIGHVVVDPTGPPCACGGFGCLEAIASGPRTVARARAAGWVGADAVALTADARAGHPVAVAALARAGEALGIGIASAVALCDVSIVVLGGGLAQAGDLLFDPLRVAYTRYARLAFSRDVPVVPAALGPNAGLIGAATLLLGGESCWSAED